MSHIRRFAGFWWSFIVGDDLPLALGVGAAIGVTAVLVDSGLDAWWLLPAAVVGLLAASIFREANAATPPAPPASKPRAARPSGG